MTDAVFFNFAKAESGNRSAGCFWNWLPGKLVCCLTHNWSWKHFQKCSDTYRKLQLRNPSKRKESLCYTTYTHEMTFLGLGTCAFFAANGKTWPNTHSHHLATEKSIKGLSWHKNLQVESCIFERSHLCSSKKQFTGNRGRWCSLPPGSSGTESRLRNMAGETGIEENWFLLCQGALLSLPVDHPGLLPQPPTSFKLKHLMWPLTVMLWSFKQVMYLNQILRKKPVTATVYNKEAIFSILKQ